MLELNHKQVTKNELFRIFFNAFKDMIIVVKENPPFILECFSKDLRVFEVEKICRELFNGE
tara:strand:+ start:102 stop:284 length:183 start_codon:yes stop_codon:yes gene_type:complete